MSGRPESVHLSLWVVSSDFVMAYGSVSSWIKHSIAFGINIAIGDCGLSILVEEQWRRHMLQTPLRITAVIKFKVISYLRY